MNKYLNQVSQITGIGSTADRAMTALGADSGTSGISAFMQNLRSEARHEVKDGLGTAIGALGGLFLTPKHRVLGAIGGASLGRNVPALLKPLQRRDALVNMGVTLAGVAGSLMMPSRKVIGFGIGWIAGNAISYFGKLRK